MKTTHTQSQRTSQRLLLTLPALFAASALTVSSLALAEATAAPAKKQPIELAAHDNSVKEKLTDSSFVEKAAIGSMTEVEISKIVAEKSSNKKIKKFATAMIKDHQAASANLKQIAVANRINLPTKLDASQQKMINEVKTMSGSKLDEMYVELMQKDHDTTVALFDNAAGEPTLNAELRVFANKTLPTLRAHQKHAHALRTTPATAAR